MTISVGDYPHIERAAIRRNAMNEVSTINANLDGFGWINRRNERQFPSKGDLLAHLSDRTEKMETSRVDMKKINLEYVENPENVDDLNRLGISIGDNAPVEFNHWSFGQLCQVARAPVSFLRGLPASLVTGTIHWQLRHANDFGPRSFYHDDGELKSVNSLTYGRVTDYDVATAAANILATGEWSIAKDHMGLQLTDRSLNMFLLSNNTVEVGTTTTGKVDTLRKGIRISNSEVGYASLRVDGFFFRDYCLNGCIFGIRDGHNVSVRHSRNAPFRWIEEVRPAIDHFINSPASKMEACIQEAKDKVIAKDDEAAINFIRSLSQTINQKSAETILQHVEAEEGHHARTAWDVINGVTAFARTASTVENRVELEMIGGKLVNRMFRQAA